MCRFNSLWLNDAIWHYGSGSTLDQVMACCLVSAWPLTEWMLINIILSIRPSGTNFSDIKIKYKTFLHENVFENIVCKMSAILFRPKMYQLPVTLSETHLDADMMNMKRILETKITKFVFFTGGKVTMSWIRQSCSNVAQCRFILRLLMVNTVIC